MTPAVMWCPNRCLHCWRAIELTIGDHIEESDNPYVSVNTSNKELYKKFHRSSKKDAWEKLNETLGLMRGLKCRTVVRINLVKDLNMEKINEYAELIKKANPMFVEVKGFMSVGFARQRLAYERMPRHNEIVEFAV